jgi:hypothetical protein
VKHDAVRAGVKLGLVVATGIWIWIAVVDALTGEPFRTFTVVGALPSSRFSITCSTSLTALPL